MLVKPILFALAISICHGVEKLFEDEAHTGAHKLEQLTVSNKPAYIQKVERLTHGPMEVEIRPNKDGDPYGKDLVVFHESTASLYVVTDLADEIDPEMS